MQAAFGTECVPLVVNGCCGNINPWDPFDPDYVPDHRRMGAALTEMGCRVVTGLSFGDASVVDWRLKRVRLPYRTVPAARQAEVDRILTESPQPKWLREDTARIDPQWFHAASTKSIEYTRRRSPDFFPYEIQVLRVGDVAFVGLPGEPFVEGQLAIKIGSPAAYTFVAHCTSHYVGYVPTREACARGGHEANDLYTWWAKLAPESLDIIVENATGMLREVFAP
jgi:hypothetical protein